MSTCTRSTFATAGVAAFQPKLSKCRLPTNERVTVMTKTNHTSHRGIGAALALIIAAALLSWSGIVSNLAAREKSERDAKGLSKAIVASSAPTPSDALKTPVEKATSGDAPKAPVAVEAMKTTSEKQAVGPESPEEYAVQRALMGWRYRSIASSVTGSKIAYGYIHDTNEIVEANLHCIGAVAMESEGCRAAIRSLSSFTIRLYNGERLEPFFDLPNYDVRYNAYGMSTVAVRWYLKNGKETLRYYDIGLSENGMALVPDQNRALEILDFLVHSTSFKVEIKTYQGTKTLDFMSANFDGKYLLRGDKKNQPSKSSLQAL